MKADHNHIAREIEADKAPLKATDIIAASSRLFSRAATDSIHDTATRVESSHVLLAQQQQLC